LGFKPLSSNGLWRDIERRVLLASSVPFLGMRGKIKPKNGVFRPAFSLLVYVPDRPRFGPARLTLGA